MKTLKSLEQALQRTKEGRGALPSTPTFRARRLDLALVFDATGSMSPYLDEVRRGLTRLSAEIAAEIGDTVTAVIVYGDYDAEFLAKTQNFTPSLESVAAFISQSGVAPNSDTPEAVEEALFEANGLSWRVSGQRALVLVGDAPPHGVTDSRQNCKRGHYYETEAQRLADKAVRIYAVQCGGDDQTSRAFARMATITAGKHIHLEKLDDLIHLIAAICMKEFGELEKYSRQLQDSKTLTESRARLIRQLTDGS